MLTLPIKKKWFDMILSGEKKEEYREIKPYYITRFVKWLGFPKTEEKTVLELMREKESIKPREIAFRNGYSADSPSFIAKCTIKIGMGREEWGAEKGTVYFILTIHEILDMAAGKEKIDGKNKETQIFGEGA